ncbi:DUF2057 family protein [Edwardsiella tarda]|uniref:DUF2057 family protein n=1 Tax=Edwardsiella tarda TaxID=636 RepID=UPI00351C55E4
MRQRVLLALIGGALLFCSPLSATTLKFGSDVELLALDGQPLPTALFKSANSLELDSGTHQVLFRVAKPFIPNGQAHYSAPCWRCSIPATPPRSPSSSPPGQ